MDIQLSSHTTFASSMIRMLENSFYYLDNFMHVVEWVSARYAHLLSAQEQARLAAFTRLPQLSRALLVRMIMRKGVLFRGSKLNYAEIGDTQSAAIPLIAQGWIDDHPLLDIDQLFSILRKSEIIAAFPALAAHKQHRKMDLRALLHALHAPLTQWQAAIDDCVYALHADLAPLCDRLRLMFFGNLHQDWSEFVLSELGVFKYEAVSLTSSSQGFDTRQHVDDYLHLHRCRERFRNSDEVACVVADIPRRRYLNDWLEARRAKLLFQIAQHYEQTGEWESALRCYADSAWPDARFRSVRVLERCGKIDAAYTLASLAEQAPESEAEQQQLLRAIPRLRRLLGHQKPPAAAVFPFPIVRHDLTLAPPPMIAVAVAAIPSTVETLVVQHLSRADAPAIYVENALINSLFGLLFWDAIFATVPGAFFHPFQSGPADLYHPDFRRRRAPHFDAGFARLDCSQHRPVILHTYRAKHGVQSPFLFWGAIDENLLTLALDCLPPLHLRKCFERILQDIKTNRSGLPDLIQFWPAEKRYCMIEVKGPGDRLQDNQLRWLRYFAQHDMPVTVCYVQWSAVETAAEAVAAP
jgi:hypothetical protein